MSYKRPSNPFQWKSEFVILGHKPNMVTVEGVGPVCECETCGAWMGSDEGCNPCGDPGGETLEAYDWPRIVRYRGVVI